MEYLDVILSAVVYLVAAFILFYLGKLIYSLFHPRIQVNNELVEKDNFAFALDYTGYFIGLTLAIGSAVVGPSLGIVQDLKDIFIYGGLALILLNVSLLINDRIILREFSVFKEITIDKNAGTGIVSAANSVAIGLIIFGAVSGEGGGVLTALVFWLVGQVALIVMSFVYNFITPFQVQSEIEKDNVAVGIAYAGAIVALGNLVRFGLEGDFVSWGASLGSAGIEVGIAMIFLPVVRFLADKILLPGRKLTDELVNQEKPNLAAGLIEAFAYVGGSVLITWCI